MYAARFSFVWALIGLVLFGAVAAVLTGMAAAFNDPIVRHDTTTVPAPLLSSSSTVAEVRERFDGAPQTMAGAQAGQAVATNCPQVDVYTAADGAVLVCHG